MVVKATYTLMPGVCQLADRQEEPNEYDNHWNDDDSRSLYAPCDLLPFKPRADVVLVGHVFAPGQAPTRSLSTRLLVGSVNKTIDVWCERLLMPDGAVREGSPFVKIPLRYERAAFGPDNPVGMRAEPRADKGGAIVLPSLQPPGSWIAGRADVIAPIGYGPIAASWPARASKLSQRQPELPADWHQRPLPEGIDPGFFNVAPLDQQMERLSADQQIVLENLHPHHARLVTALPGILPRATVERGGRGEELSLSADTLWFDTDRAVCTLTWRGQLRLDRPDVPGRVSITMVQNGPEHSVAPTDGAMGISVDTLLPKGSVPQRAILLHETETQTAPLGFGEETLQPSRTSHRSSPMPFVTKSAGEGASAPLWNPPKHAPDPPNEDAGATLFVSASSLQSTPLPFVRSGEDAPAPEPPAALPVHPLHPAMFGPAGMQPSAPEPPPVAAPLPLSVASPPPHPAAAPAPLVTSVGFSDPSIASPGGLPQIGLVASLKDAGMVAGMPPPSATAASNSAADPWQGRGGFVGGAMSPLRPRTPVELLWFDPTFAEAIRKDPGMKALLAEHQKSRARKKEDNKSAPARPAPGQPDPKDREDINAILALGEPSGVEALGVILDNALDEWGVFRAPVVLLGGDLSFPFDEVETLRATVAAVAPLAAADKKLKETIDAVGELLRTPWLQAAGSGTERVTTQIKEALAASSRPPPQGYLASHTERILLENRHYQKRALLGQQWIRALFGSQGTSTRVPAYIPHSLARDLPMYQHFPVRMIAEVKTQIDQYETHPSALRVVALGRVLGGAPRR